MTMIIRLMTIATMVAIGTHGATAQSHNHSKYSGQELRQIKSLSQKDIDELQRGGGWGLAKAAELNGVPGPLHLLELAEEVKLSDVQVEQITVVYEKMQLNAKVAGQTYISNEKTLDDWFQEANLDAEELRNLINESEKARAKLRLIHLSAHLEMMHIVTSEQVDTYNKLRGYFSSDPCTNVPEGHNAEMWKKHNDCG